MSKSNSTILQEVKAEDLKREITQDASKLSLRLRTGKSLLPLSNARIVGSLELKHRTIDKPIEITDCVFENELDLRYGEFKQVVNFSGCTFKCEINSGDETESHTVYKKDLICNRVRFEGPARFNGIQVEGSAYFRKACFLNAEPSIDLMGASIKKSLEFTDSIVEGLADFSGLKCDGYGVFDRVSFCGGGKSQGKVTLTLSSFGGTLNFESAIFRGPADLSALKCDGDGIFDGATFEKEVFFNFSTFGRNLTCCDVTTFKGPAGFNTIKCDGSGFFSNARFEFQDEEETTQNKWGVDFIAASFGANLDFEGATFEGSATFSSLACGGNGFFRHNFRAKNLDFTLASFGGDLEFVNAKVEGEANFNRLKCDGAGNFTGAQFGRFVGWRYEGERIDLSFTHFGSNLSLDNATFGGEVDMSAARISQDLTFTDGLFEQRVILNNASSDQVKLQGTNFPFNSPLLDLREYTFRGFSGPDENSEELALRFARAQDPFKFGRDPYLQLEKYYSSIGNEVQAKAAYYEGRRDLRHNVKKYRNKSTTKPTKLGKRINKWRRVKLTSWGDWCLKWFTGYGVKTERLLIPILVVFVIGFGLFSVPSNALKTVETDSSSAAADPSANLTADGIQMTAMSAGKKEVPEDKGPNAIDEFAYNLDLFLPLDLSVADEWELQKRWLEIYGLGHQLIGWILIPILLASLGGIIRKQ
jgi:hypothetical protein